MRGGWCHRASSHRERTEDDSYCPDRYGCEARFYLRHTQSMGLSCHSSQARYSTGSDSLWSPGPFYSGLEEDSNKISESFRTTSPTQRANAGLSQQSLQAVDPETSSNHSV